MDTNNLNIIYYLIYVEIIIISFVCIRQLLNITVSFIASKLNVIEHNRNFLILLTEFPTMLLSILIIGQLTYVNTLDKTIGIKILYFTSSLLLILIYRILYQGDISKICKERYYAFLPNYPQIYFNITYLVYLVFFLIISCGIINLDNFLTDFILASIEWLINLKYIGWLLITATGFMIFGTFKIAVFGLYNLIFRRKHF